MSITLDRAQLADALRALRSVTSTRSALPVLANVALDARNDVLTLSATSLEAWGVRRVPYEGKGLEPTTVNVKALADYAAAFTGDDVTLEVDGNKLRVTSGRHKASLATIDRDEFPVFPDTSDGVRFDIAPDMLARIIARTVPFAATDEARPILTGVSVSASAGVARFAAADNYRIGVVTAEVETQEAFEAVLPARALALVSKVVPEVVSVQIGTSTARFEGGYADLTMRLVQGQYPNIDALLNGEKAGAILFSREEYADAAKLAGLTGALISKFSVTPDGLHIEASMMDNNFETTLDATISVEGEPTFALNSKYAQSVASVLSDSTEVEILYGGSPLAPVEFRDHADASFRCVVMPVRTAGN